MTTQTQFAVGDRVYFDYEALGQAGMREKVGVVTDTTEHTVSGSRYPRIYVRWDSDFESSSPVKRYLRLVHPAGPDRIEEMFS